MTQPDLVKVAAAVAAMERRKAARDARKDETKIANALANRPMRQLPLLPSAPSAPAQDSAIRKPLRAHGFKCCGFNHAHFMNND